MYFVDCDGLIMFYVYTIFQFSSFVRCLHFWMVLHLYVRIQVFHTKHIQSHQITFECFILFYLSHLYHGCMMQIIEFYSDLLLQIKLIIQLLFNNTFETKLLIQYIVHQFVSFFLFYFCKIFTIFYLQY